MYGASSGQGRRLPPLDLEEVAYVMTSKTGIELESGVVSGMRWSCR